VPGDVKGGTAGEAVTVLPGGRRVAGPGWSLRAERVDMLGAARWRALVGIRRGLKLLVTGTGQPDQLWVEAWAGEPGQSAGVAVVDTGNAGPAVARVPVCRCGEPGCGNAGVQLSKQLADDELPALVDLLRELPWTAAAPVRSNVLRGRGLAAMDERRADPAADAAWYAYSPLTGKSRYPGPPGSDQPAS
jgi:hypothetical protein